MNYYMIRNEANKMTGEVIKSFADLEDAMVMAQLYTTEFVTANEYAGGDITIISEDGEKIASYYIAKKKAASTPPPVKKESEKINFEVLGFHKRNEWSDRYWNSQSR